MKTVRRLLSAVFLILATQSFAQTTAQEYVVQLTATVKESPATITLHWPADPHSIQVTLNRRVLGDIPGWGQTTLLSTKDTQYVDTSVVLGQAYEYRITDHVTVGSQSWMSYGYIASGVKVMPTPQGTVVLLVDSTFTTSLATEIDRLISDLEAEGHQVIRHDVLRTASDVDVKALVANDYLADMDHVTTLFILGHVPVPYSGDIAPDGHVPGQGNHQGAWSTDTYYGEFFGDWTDTDVDDTTANRQANRNVPGDGKFDQGTIPSDMELEVGRVDFANMSAFAASEEDLLRSYLNKDHAYRTGQLVVRQRALVNINFPVFAWYDVPGEDAWRNFPPLVGRDSIDNFHTITTATDWTDLLDSNSYLWAYGCGGGSYTSCSGVGTTNDFAGHDLKAVFYMVFGSFFGDWDAPNDFMRAPLASGYGLASCWASRPFWFVHPMAIGKSIGYCTKITMNNGVTDLDYNNGVAVGGIHLGLMGDPTLQQTYLPPPTTPAQITSVTTDGSIIKLSWSPSVPARDGYDIYRAKKRDGAYTKLNGMPIETASYTDSLTLTGSSFYLIRPASLITSASGSYYVEGPGFNAEAYLPLGAVASATPEAPVLQVTQSPSRIAITFVAKAVETYKLDLVDELGRTIAHLGDGMIYPSSKHAEFPTQNLASGTYFVHLSLGGSDYTAKVLIEK